MQTRPLIDSDGLDAEPLEQLRRTARSRRGSCTRATPSCRRRETWTCPCGGMRSIRGIGRVMSQHLTRCTIVQKTMRLPPGSGGSGRTIDDG